MLETIYRAFVNFRSWVIPLLKKHSPFSRGIKCCSFEGAIDSTDVVENSEEDPGRPKIDNGTRFGSFLNIFEKYLRNFLIVSSSLINIFILSMVQLLSILYHTISFLKMDSISWIPTTCNTLLSICTFTLVLDTLN